jgi:hypothetical protein
LSFPVYSSYKEELELLQNYIDNKIIPVSVYLSTDYICLSFDDSKLYGFAIDEKQRKKEVAEIKKNHINKEVVTDLIKQCYVKHYKLLEEKQLSNKLSNRAFSVDTNPDYIGCSILDLLPNGEIKIVKAFHYDLTDANASLPKEFTQEQRTHENNKRKRLWIFI